MGTGLSFFNIVISGFCNLPTQDLAICLLPSFHFNSIIIFTTFHYFSSVEVQLNHCLISSTSNNHLLQAFVHVNMKVHLAVTIPSSCQLTVYWRGYCICRAVKTPFSALLSPIYFNIEN